MRFRAIALAAGLVVAHGAANAWFFFLPTGAIQSAIQGDTCLPASARVGDKIQHQGREYLVKATNGTSSRCSHTPQWPIIGKIEPVLTQAELQAEQSVCLPPGAAPGYKTSVPTLGEVEVRSVGGSDCSDIRNPVSARVVRVGALVSPAQPQPVATPQARPQEAVTERKSVPDRLRDLKALRDENLITQDLYESKQREILATP